VSALGLFEVCDVLSDIAHEKERLIFGQEGAITAVTDGHRKLEAGFGDVPELAQLVVQEAHFAAFRDHFLDVHERQCTLGPAPPKRGFGLRFGEQGSNAV
jgi:hypothetical protein